MNIEILWSLVSALFGRPSLQLQRYEISGPHDTMELQKNMARQLVRRLGRGKRPIAG